MHANTSQGGCSPAVAALTSGFLAVLVFFALPFSYVVYVYDDDWGMGDAAQVDADAVLLVLLLSGASTLAAISTMMILRRHKSALIVAGLFALLAAFRFVSVLPLYEG
ncbi:hypothetical protein [Nonomuraea dietziae]|uniref:hypothetical protein n=1 Tax=Nonomuraea dietziae TaxID=65515 RepID=UPI00343FA05D